MSTDYYYKCEALGIYCPDIIMSRNTSGSTSYPPSQRTIEFLNKCAAENELPSIVSQDHVCFIEDKPFPAPDAFERLNNRRLFLMLERAITEAAEDEHTMDILDTTERIADFFQERSGVQFQVHREDNTVILRFSGMQMNVTKETEQV